MLLQLFRELELLVSIFLGGQVRIPRALLDRGFLHVKGTSRSMHLRFFAYSFQICNDVDIMFASLMAASVTESLLCTQWGQIHLQGLLCSYNGI